MPRSKFSVIFVLFVEIRAMFVYSPRFQQKSFKIRDYNWLAWLVDDLLLNAPTIRRLLFLLKKIFLIVSVTIGFPLSLYAWISWLPTHISSHSFLLPMLPIKIKLTGVIAVILGRNSHPTSRRDFHFFPVKLFLKNAYCIRIYKTCLPYM